MPFPFRRFFRHERPLRDRMRAALSNLIELLGRHPRRCPNKSSPYCRDLARALRALGAVWREAGLQMCVWDWFGWSGDAGWLARCFLGQACSLLDTTPPRLAEDYVAGLLTPAIMTVDQEGKPKDLGPKDLDAMRAEVERFAELLLSETE